MDRSNLIQAIMDSHERWSCPNDKNCTHSCRKCSEKLLKDYEDSIRKEAIEEYKKSGEV